jgi:RNA polymerase sigma-70 factor (ECF subfamily)
LTGGEAQATARQRERETIGMIFGRQKARQARTERALERHQAELVRYAASILRDEDRARDVVQEGFLRLWRHEPELPESETAPWLFTVCRNLALDILRKEKRMVSLSPDAPLVGEDPAATQAELEAKEGLSEILHALAGLPASQQEVIRLKFQNGLSYKDIGRITGHSVGNVGYLIHTGIKALRQQLAAQAVPAVEKGGAK